MVRTPHSELGIKSGYNILMLKRLGLARAESGLVSAKDSMWGREYFPDNPKQSDGKLPMPSDRRSVLSEFTRPDRRSFGYHSQQPVNQIETPNAVQSDKHSEGEVAPTPLPVLEAQPNPKKPRSAKHKQKIPNEFYEPPSDESDEPPPDDPSELPPVTWVEKKDKDGNVYYKNYENKRITYKLPKKKRGRTLEIISYSEHLERIKDIEEREKKNLTRSGGSSNKTEKQISKIGKRNTIKKLKKQTKKSRSYKRRTIRKKH
jgi:hypothetical protein